eukprot:TRINITY_DN12282_c0_g1_i1.p1 TRINITY_DN12282_c0_g1~~TRINITY_DN12282_c0_g1_i1.p1  ORF type:complete len:251 (-),score=24.08 TRINITY_DN12282_c0_g1_i1:57-785(-)
MTEAKRLYSSKFRPYHLPKIIPKYEGHWKDAFLMYKNRLNDPDFPQIFYQDEDVLTIVDAYPKARIHLLIIPQKDIRDIRLLTSEHVPLLEKFKNLADEIVHYFVTEKTEAYHNPNYTFRMGFHSVQSMNQVHMHLISNDMDSPAMKKKHHYISFTNDTFFFPIDNAISDLKQHGKLVLLTDEEYEAILKGPLVSHLNGKEFGKSFKKLKDHLTIEAKKTLGNSVPTSHNNDNDSDDGENNQ